MYFQHLTLGIISDTLVISTEKLQIIILNNIREKNVSKNIMRVAVFIVVAVLCILYLVQVFTYPRSDEARKTFNSFYNEAENTIDGVYLGASSANRYWIAPKAFNDEGIVVASLATTNQPFIATKYLMEEAYKTQDPELFVVEIRWAFKSALSMGDAGLRRVCDNMKMSRTRIALINAAVDFAANAENDVSQKKIEYYFPFVKYHDRWNSDNFNRNDVLLREFESNSKGFLLTKDSFEVEEQKAAELTRKSKNIDINT